MDKKTLNALQACPLFEGLSGHEIEKLMQSVGYRLVRYEQKDIYALYGTPLRHVDVMVTGEVTARMVGSSGKFVQMAHLMSGALMAPAYIFSKDKALPVSIETVKATTFLRMTPDSLRRLMTTDPRIQMNFIRQLSTVAAFLAKKVRMLTLHNVREKVALFLLEESEHSASDVFTLTKSRQEIADSFAIQKYSLQRCLREFSAEAMIRSHGKTIEILDKPKLRRIVE